MPWADRFGLQGSPNTCRRHHRFLTYPTLQALYLYIRNRIEPVHRQEKAGPLFGGG